MKKLIPLIVFFILFSITLSAQMKVQTGTYLADNRISNYSLAYGGELERTHEIFVRFQKPYLEKPEIITSVTVYDGSRDSNTRFEIKTKDV